MCSNETFHNVDYCNQGALADLADDARSPW